MNQHRLAQRPATLPQRGNRDRILHPNSQHN